LSVLRAEHIGTAGPHARTEVYYVGALTYRSTWRFNARPPIPPARREFGRGEIGVEFAGGAIEPSVSHGRYYVDARAARDFAAETRQSGCTGQPSMAGSYCGRPGCVSIFAAASWWATVCGKDCGCTKARCSPRQHLDRLYWGPPKNEFRLDIGMNRRRTLPRNWSYARSATACRRG